MGDICRCECTLCRVQHFADKQLNQHLVTTTQGEAQSAWICVTGRAAVDGTFSDFVTTLLNSTVRFVANKGQCEAAPRGKLPASLADAAPRAL